MPYCPSCLTEYREGFDTCADCHVPLVEALPPEPEPEPLPDPVDFGDPVLLLTADNELTADMQMALLEANHIPAYRKFLAAGGYLSIYMGVTSFGIEIYVPRTLLGQAQELIDAFCTAAEEEYGESIDEYDEYTDEQ